MLKRYPTGLIAACLIAGSPICNASGTAISTPGLSLRFTESGVPASVQNTTGDELLSPANQRGFYLLESDRSSRRFDSITDLGGGEYQFAMSGFPESFIAHFAGSNDYLTVRFTSMKNFAREGERLYFELNTRGTRLQALALDYMIEVAGNRSFVKLERQALWETSDSNTLGAFALYEFKDHAQEDDTLLDLWVHEGLPHPKVSNPWDRETAEAWLDDWIAMAYDTGYLNIEPADLEEHHAYIPYAEAMDAKAIYLWNLIWRGEYWLHHRQNDEINPDMYPNGLDDLRAFTTASGRDLMLHYLSGNIGEEDPEFSKTAPSPDLQSWGTMTLDEAVSESASSMIVQLDSGTEMPIITTSIHVKKGPPFIPRFFEFKTFRIADEWVSAQTATDLGDGRLKLNGVTRGKWNTKAANHPVGTSLRGYLRSYNQDFVPDPNSALLETIAVRWAALNNTLRTTKSEFDGLENHVATGNWGAEKFAALVYENLDHPSTANTSSGRPPAAWLEYRFNRVKDALGGRFQTRQHASLFLGDRSRTTPGIEDLENEMNKFFNVNNRGFSLGSYDVKGVTLSTLSQHGLTDQILELLKNWKAASLPMSAAQRESMNTFRPFLRARLAINGNHHWATALWRLDGSLLRKWHALGTDTYTHEWHFGQEHGTITPRFYLKNGESKTLSVPPELTSGLQQTRIIGRVLPRYDADSDSNMDLMEFLEGGDRVAVARSNSTDSDVWSDTDLEKHRIHPAIDLRNNRGLGLWITGDGSNATLVIRLHQNHKARDYVVPINFTGRRWIEIPTGELAWRVRNWGWALATRKFLNYQYINAISVGLGHVPANTSSRVTIEGLTALSEINEALVAPTLRLGEKSVAMTGTVDTEKHFIFDPDGTFTIYDELWNATSTEHLGKGLLSTNLTSFSMQSPSSSNIWLEIGVQVSNEAIEAD